MRLEIIITSLLFGLAAGFLSAWVFGGISLRKGWQTGHSLLSRWLNARRRARFEEQLPEALATMNNALRAGLSITQAFDSVVANSEKPLSEEFLLLTQQLRVGMSLEAALDALCSRVGSEDLSLVATAILIARKTGGNLTEIFARIAETIRSRMKIARKVKTLTAQGRLQGLIVSLMPIFLLVVMTILKPGMMLPFLSSPIGLVSLGAMVALITLGWLMIRRIIRIDI